MSQQQVRRLVLRSLIQAALAVATIERRSFERDISQKCKTALANDFSLLVFAFSRHFLLTSSRLGKPCSSSNLVICQSLRLLSELVGVADLHTLLLTRDNYLSGFRDSHSFRHEQIDCCNGCLNSSPSPLSRLVESASDCHLMGYRNSCAVCRGDL